MKELDELCDKIEREHLIEIRQAEMRAWRKGWNDAMMHMPCDPSRVRPDYRHKYREGWDEQKGFR